VKNGFCDPFAWREQQTEIEEERQECKSSTLMLSRSKYQQPCSAAEDAWKHTDLAQDVEALQQQKQHHLHMADKQGVRQPLNHGRDPKDPTMVGMPWGPCHDPNLYGNYPALLAALQRRMQRTLPFGNAPSAASQRGTDQPSCASW